MRGRKKKQPQPDLNKPSLVPENKVANPCSAQNESPLWALASALMNIHENITGMRVGVGVGVGLFTSVRSLREGTTVSDGSWMRRWSDRRRLRKCVFVVVFVFLPLGSVTRETKDG